MALSECPRKVIARSKEPLLSPSEDNREGYVPNVIYTCGALRVGDWIFMPYGVADSSIHFASIKISDLLAHLGVWIPGLNHLSSQACHVSLIG